MEDKPFSDLKISPHQFLDGLQGRSECPQCKRSRKYYCYTCYVPVDLLSGKIPQVKLPIKIDIIKHPSEVDGKSTSAHAKVLAPDDVCIYTYPCIPDYPRDGSVVLVFPNDDASMLKDIATGRLQPGKTDMETDGTLHQKNETASGKHNTCQEISTKLGETMEENVCNSNSDTPSKLPEADRFESENESVQNVLKTNNDEKLLQEIAPIQSCQSEVNPTSESKNLTSNLCELGEPHGLKRKQENGDELTGDKKSCDIPVLERAIFIDSTWNQTSRISTDERLKGLPCIILKERESKFWRHQRENPPSYLSTIEAVYYLVRDYHELFLSANYNGEYDDLLFFFDFMYHKIHGLYTDRDLKADSQRKKNKKNKK